MKLSEVVKFPRAYTIMETDDSRFMNYDEVKVCLVNEESLLVAVGYNIFYIDKKDATSIKVKSR
jgi:hypothetical protein